jgi:hypothetical protein
MTPPEIDIPGWGSCQDDDAGVNAKRSKPWFPPNAIEPAEPRRKPFALHATYFDRCEGAMAGALAASPIAFQAAAPSHLRTAGTVTISAGRVFDFSV